MGKRGTEESLKVARHAAARLSVDQQSKPRCRRLAQVPPGAEAPGSTNKGDCRPLGARFTGLGSVSPTLERRAAAAQEGTAVYESFDV